MWPELFHTLWTSFHTIARALPRGTLTHIQKQQFIDYVRSFLPLVPCEGCAMHAMSYLIHHPLNPKTGDDAFAWTVQFHNFVSKSLGKREFTVEEAELDLNNRTNKDFKALLRDTQRQKIDHTKMRAMQKELDTLKNIPHAAKNSTQTAYLIAAIVLAVIILIALVVFFATMMAQLSHLKRSVFVVSRDAEFAV